MADGSRKAIKEIRVKDEVRSGVRRSDVAVVNAVYSRVSTNLHEIRLAETVASGPKCLLATAEHLFWRDGKGWTPVGQLKVGDWLLNSGGMRLQVAGNQLQPAGEQVYTLSLSGDCAFYAEDVLVHDVCGVATGSTAAKAPEVAK